MARIGRVVWAAQIPGGFGQVGEVGLGVDRGDRLTEAAAPVRGKDRLGGEQQVRPHLAFRRGQPQWTQRGAEDLRGEVLGVGTVADPRVHQPVEPVDVVAVHRLPVAVGVIVNHVQVADVAAADHG